MRKKALNVIMGLIMAGSAAVACKSEGAESAGWTVAAVCCAIFLMDKFGPKD
jgi:hypothetical protein